MVSLWAWAVLLLLLCRFALEFRILATSSKRHKYQFEAQAGGWGWKYFYPLNLAVFVLHAVLLGIFWEQADRNSVMYWLYAMTVYYFLQGYLAFIVPRNDREDERIAVYIIYASFACLLLALAGLLYNDFCPNIPDTICDEQKAGYYAGLWPIQATVCLIYGTVDCLLWARKAEARCCPDAFSGYGIQLQRAEHGQDGRYAGGHGMYLNNDRPSVGDVSLNIQGSG